MHRVHYRGTISNMKLARSRITAQGQLSVPVEVRRKLGVGPGSVLEWSEEGEAIVVRRAGQFDSEDIHRALFKQKTPKPRTIEEMKQGIRKSIRTRHARD
jgi:AbrB family looped-hinge helix DNA binding protein